MKIRTVDAAIVAARECRLSEDVMEIVSRTPWWSAAPYEESLFRHHAERVLAKMLTKRGYLRAK